MKMSSLFEGLYGYEVAITHHIHGVAQKTKRFKPPSEIKGISVTPDFLLKLTPVQMQAIELAVNNHDALIDMLTRLVNEVQFEFSSDVALMEEGDNLLNKIKGEIV